MPTTDPLEADIQHDIVAFKRHLNPLLLPLEEAIERQHVRTPAVAPGAFFGPEATRLVTSYMALSLRPFAPTAWLEFWAASVAWRAAAVGAVD